MAETMMYESGIFGISIDEMASLYERHLADDHAVRPRLATPRQYFEALARSVRDLIIERWLATMERYDQANSKRVYYLSMEYLIGRSLWNNVVNLRAVDTIRELAHREGFDLDEVIEQEPDAGRGNGGLGRLAACYLDSLATLQIPAIGYGLRYDYGIFRQEIVDGYQKESPDHWLLHPDPWEVSRAEEQAEVKLDASLRLNWATHEHVPDQTMTLVGVPYDRPVVGYSGQTVNTLRLWRATSPEYFDLEEFDSGDFVGAMLHRIVAGSVTRVLYPDDETSRGRMLRFIQEYFLVGCSLADIVARFRRDNSDWHALPEKVAVQLNDTHPSLAVAELMRILLDDAGLGWDDAWDLTRRTFAFTNHTLLSEALEEWAVTLFEQMLPRHLDIIYEINRRLLDEVRLRYPSDLDRVRRISLIAEGPEKRVRMAHLATVGSHAVNGVAALHSELLKASVLKDFYELWPERFGNVTNGVTPRRFLALSNPGLRTLLDDTIGDGWLTDLDQLRRLEDYVEDPAFRQRWREVKRANKRRLAEFVHSTTGIELDHTWMFDIQVKRIHEYKRQHLNALHIITLYNRLKQNPGF
ncbi:MAG: glycogen/starch/alpha-glucan family phosphorylase, partial [Planctomycetes bacterium]|nr:glycogen/starch/alpha-glucan family phosphorylase [Planctomycetota bacterium]